MGTMISDSSDSKHLHKYCVIGAGSSGLAVAKNFAQYGIEFDCLEREDDVGGIWNYGRPASSVYASTHLVSSKRLTEYTDFPLPDDYPDFPGHRQIWQYMRAYAREFKLYEAIEFGREIRRIEPVGDHWLVTLDGDERRRYRGVVIANGHNWDPSWPEIPGHFDGDVLHSAEYKTPDVLRDRRVLVVGGGNSGCDIAVEAAQHASRAVQSTRRGYYYLPKYLFGIPVDQCGERMLRWGLPLWLRRLVARALVRVALGPPHRCGLPTPDHKLFESHPIINSQLHHVIGHGMLTLRPDVAELCGRRVRFVDGSEEEIDLIVYATGFRISFPFIDKAHLNWRNGKPDLYLNIFHPEQDHLFVAGLIQPDSGQWGLVDTQAQLIARVVRAQDHQPAVADRFRRLKSGPRRDLGGGIRYVESSRHLLAVEHFSYRNHLEDLIRQYDC